MRSVMAVFRGTMAACNIPSTDSRYLEPPRETEKSSSYREREENSRE